MLGFCDEVVVVDGGSTDGTWEELHDWALSEPRLKVHKEKGIGKVKDLQSMMEHKRLLLDHVAQWNFAGNKTPMRL